MRRSSGSWLIPSPVPWELSPTPSCQQPLPELPDVAMASGLCFQFPGMEESLFFILEGHPLCNGERKQATKGGALFWMGIPDCSHISQVRPNQGNVGFFPLKWLDLCLAARVGNTDYYYYFPFMTAMCLTGD